MIEFKDVSKFYGDQDILIEATFQVTKGERVGVVGPNGAGKSTLFALLTGQTQVDRGEILLPKQVRLGHLKQQLNAYAVTDTLLEYTTHAVPEFETVQNQIHAIEHELEAGTGDQEKHLEKLGRLQTEFEAIGGYELQTRAEAALCGLGFSVEALQQPFTQFSGGWQMRAEMARTLIGYPDLLLLDEPSNYLDLPAVEWLQKFLRGYPGTMLLISHDRYLLRSLATTTVEIAGGRLTKYAGGLDYYLSERDSRHSNALAAKKNQDRKIEQVERFVERFRSKNAKARQVQSRIKALDKLERVEVPVLAAEHSAIRIPEPPHCGHEVARLENVGHHYDPDKPVLSQVNLTLNRGDKVALVGYNGMGKTTLQRILAGALTPTSGKRVLGHKVVPGYQSQDFAETMNPEASVFDIVRGAHPTRDGNRVRTMLGSFGFGGDDVHKLCKILSGGEKIRLAFARIFINPPNLLILDEPTTHLDLAGRNALEQALRDYTGTLCVVSHDVTFVKAVANRIVAMTPPGITNYPGTYDYYLEKSGGLDAAPTVARSGPADRQDAVPVDKKTLRKMRAAEREAFKKQERGFAKQVRNAEKEIERLELEQTGLVEQLTVEGTDFETVNRRLSQLQYELGIANGRWEEASLALEELQNERD